MKQRWELLVPVGAIATVILISKPWSHVSTLQHLWQQRQQQELETITAPPPQSPPRLGSIWGQVIYDANGNGQPDQQTTVIYSESFEAFEATAGRRDRSNASTSADQSVTSESSPSESVTSESIPSESVTPMWSNVQTTALPSVSKDQKMGQKNNQILGFFGGVETDGLLGQTTLTLDELLPHHTIELAFDLWIVGSWDGNLDADFAPDLWELRQGTDTLLRTAFSNIASRAKSQAYPLPYPEGQVAPRTNASTPQTLPQEYSENSTYRIRQRFAHDDPQLTVNFSGQGKTSLADNERWGLDNLTVTLRSGEIGVSDVIIFLDQNQNGVRDADEPTTTTDADGNYQFQGLTAGPYRVRVGQQIFEENGGLPESGLPESGLPENSQETLGEDAIAKELSLMIPYQDIQILGSEPETVIFLNNP